MPNKLRNDATRIAALVAGLTFIGSQVFLHGNLDFTLVVMVVQVVAIKGLAVVLEPWA